MRLFTTTALAAVLTVPGMAIAQTQTDEAADERLEVEVEEVESIEQTGQQTEETQTTEGEVIDIQGVAEGADAEAQQRETEQVEGVRETEQVGAQATQQPAVTAGEIIALNRWGYDENIYAKGWSADAFIDEMEVYGAAGDDIGDVEDLIIDADGKLVAAVAEIGGFIDIGDTHVSIPWDEIEVDFAQERVLVPVTEENVENYEPTDGVGPLQAEQVTEQVAAGVDDVPTGRATFRLSELIGDYARIRADGGQEQAQQAQTGQQQEGQQAPQQMQEQPGDRQRPAPTGMMAAPGMAPAGMMDYGYVSDVIIRDDEVAAVVVQPRGGYGGGFRAYPYYGYDQGWRPGDRYYDMPYTAEETGELEQFEYGELEYRLED